MRAAKVLIPMAFLLSIGLASCTMNQQIALSRDGSGTVELDISLADYLTEVVSQVQGLVEPENPRPADAAFFDTDAISEDFSKRDDVQLDRLSSPTPNQLSGSFRFDDVNSLYREATEQTAASRLLNLRDDGDAMALSVSVNRNTIEALLDEHPSMNNPLVANFGPTANAGLSENDYLDMMEYALGEESRQGILDSSLVLTIAVDGTILEQQGGTSIDASTVRYDIPLLPVLLLNKPLEYSLRFQ